MPATPFDRAGVYNIISHSSTGYVSERWYRVANDFGCSSDDCQMSDLESIPEWDLAYKQGFRSRYRIQVATYRGWKVYMLMTGCYATIPQHEEATARHTDEPRKEKNYGQPPDRSAD